MLSTELLCPPDQHAVSGCVPGGGGGGGGGIRTMTKVIKHPEKGHNDTFSFLSFVEKYSSFGPRTVTYVERSLSGSTLVMYPGCVCNFGNGVYSR